MPSTNCIVRDAFFFTPDLPAYDGRVVAMAGRFSYRQAGRWLGERKCGQKFVWVGQEWP
jgi:hypothetical protein